MQTPAFLLLAAALPYAAVHEYHIGLPSAPTLVYMAVFAFHAVWNLTNSGSFAALMRLCTWQSHTFAACCPVKQLLA